MQLGKLLFQNCLVSLLLFFRAVEISLVISLRTLLKSLSHFTSQYWYGCYR